MSESSLTIGFAITPMAALMPVRGRFTRIATRPATDRPTFVGATPLYPIRDDGGAPEAAQDMGFSPPSPAWFGSLDPVAQYQFYANLFSGAYRPALSVYA